jgi:subtilisin family serine protease
MGLDRVAVTIRLSERRDLEKLMRIQSSDLRVRQRGGRVTGLGRVFVALVTDRGLSELARTDFVERVELDMVPPTRQPLDFTGAEVEAFDAWRTMDGDSVSLTGHGIVIADIDSGIDPFHPAFFKPDGGYFSWIDVDSNGMLDPGVDGVDLDGDGVVGSGETIRFFDGEAFCMYTSYSPILDSDDGELDLGWDWLYADLDGDMTRDFGPTEGYTEEDASLGEPLFVPDDVNGNGRLDPSEKLIALGSSKILAAYDGDREYLRGEGLMDITVDEQTLHGTGVAGVLVGGVLGSTTLTGLAPDAELLMASHTADPYGSTSDLLVWTVQSGADIVLHEYAPWAGTHLDGSTNQESIMDDASDMGVAQINPTGNLGGAKKHCNLDLEPSGAVDLPVIVPQDPPYGHPYAYLSLTFHWRMPARDLSFVLTTPSNEVIDLGVDGGYWELSDGTTMVQAYRDDSNRGTAMFDIVAAGWDGYNFHPIENGQWTLSVTDTSGAPATDPAVELSGYVMDNVTSWEQGAYFPEHTSERHLICFPATADSAISVAAYTGHDSHPYDPGDAEVSGELRRYSCRGTRLDGASIMDIAAPDNPLTPINRMNYYGIEIGHGAYMVFGGTSGAGPHVAAAAALLKQQNPDLTGSEVKQLIRQGALVDDQVVGDTTHPVQDLWGAGKLRIHQSLHSSTPEANTPPTIAFDRVEIPVGQESPIEVEVSDGEDDPSDLQLRWDDDYDGVWEWGPHPVSSPRRVRYDATGIYPVKVEVIDTGGMTAAAVGEIEVVEQTMGDGGVGDGGTSQNGSGNGSGCSCRASRESGGGPALFLWLLLALALVSARVRLRASRR